MKISSFLKERTERFKPEEANKLNLKRLQKIDFSGNMHFLEGKKTNTGMILIKEGDLVISGINVEKGAVAVYQDDEDVLATIHYSSYEFDKNKIDIDYFKWFLKSDAFRKVILSQTRGGIKTEIKSKSFLPLEIDLPDLRTQKQILQKINSMKNEINDLEQNVSYHEKLLFFLKQAILSEAVKGKLVEQNSNEESASELLKKIKAEKQKLIKDGKIKKQKELPAISEDEIPYDLPKGWIWARLGDVLELCEYGTSQKCTDFGNAPVFSMGNINDGKVKDNNLKLLSKNSDDLPRLYLKNKDLLFNRTNSYELVGKTGIFEGEDNKFSFASYLIRLRTLINPYYLNYYLQSSFFRKTQIEPEIIQQCGQANFNGTKLKNTFLPLPPLPEQRRIVEKVDALMRVCDELELRIKENKSNSKSLMGAVLGESFEDGKD